MTKKINTVSQWTENTLYFESMDSNSVFFAEMIKTNPFPKCHSDLKEFQRCLDIPQKVYDFSDVALNLYYSFISDDVLIVKFADFYEEHLHAIIESKQISKAQIETWYPSLNWLWREYFKDSKQLFRLLKILFFDASDDTERVHIKLDLFCATLYALKDFMTNWQKYQLHFFFYLGESFFKSGPTRKLYEPIYKGITSQINKRFFQILREYQPRYSDEKYAFIHNQLSESFVKLICKIADTRILPRALYFLWGNFQQFVKNYENDFRVGILYGVFYFDNDFLVIDSFFYELFFKKNLEITPLTDVSSEDNLNVLEQTPFDQSSKDTYAIYKEFFDTGNVNKKTISLSKTHVDSTYNFLRYYTPNQLDKTIADIIYYKLKTLIIYKRYIWWIMESMQEQVLVYTRKLYMLEEVQAFFDWALGKYEHQILKYEDFIALFKMHCPHFLKTFLQIYWIIDREINYRLDGDDFTYEVLLNNIFLECANLWMIDTYSTTVSWEYRSFHSNGYTENPIYEYQKIKYIRFKTPSLQAQKSPDLKNSITANTLYLTPSTPNHLIQQLACCTILEKIDAYIVLTLNRETIIKANNKFEMSNPQILKLLTKDLKLSLPKNIELLLSELWNKPHDVTLVASWIPLIVSEEGTYQDLLKLKTVSNQILYKDDQLRLIVFSNKFTGLGTLLTKRNLIINKIGWQ